MGNSRQIWILKATGKHYIEMYRALSLNGNFCQFQ